MKKIILTVAGSMFIALAAVNAQERSDTTKTKQSTQYRTESGTQSQTPTIQGQSGTQGQYQQWREDEGEAVGSEDLPEGLITTLESDQYKGWENATIYRNKSTSDYMLVIQDNGETKTFYFDSEGKSRMNLSGQSSGVPESGQISGQTSSSSSGQPSGQTSGNVSASESGVSAAMQTPQWRKEDRIKIRTGQIPNPMLITLGDPMYRGWEKAAVYRNKSTNEYMIEIKDGSETKTYNFDKEGKALSSNTGQGNYNDQSSYRNDQPPSTSDSKTKSTGQQTTSGAIGTSQVGDDEDAAGDKKDDKKDYQLNQGSVQDGSKMDQSAQWKNEDRVMVSSSEIPVMLRTTLSEDKYKGWENSSIYRNKSTNEYMIEIRDGSAARTYYFDKNGNAINQSQPENNDQGSSYRDETGKTKASGSDKSGGSGYSSTEQKVPAGNTTSAGYQQWKDEDRVLITTSEVPSSLRMTLSDDPYKGWEKSTIYRNRNTNEYMVQIKDGSNTKTYYFDSSGKSITIESDDKDDQ